MPEIYHHPIDRRCCLKIGTLAGLGVLIGVPASAAGEDAATPAPAAFHLALLSDTHIPGDRKDGHRSMNPWENLKQILPDVTAARPEGVILNGDAARLEGHVEDYAELKALLDTAAVSAPVFIGMGNHDDRANFHQVFADGAGKTRLKDKCVLVIEHPLRPG